MAYRRRWFIGATALVLAALPGCSSLDTLNGLNSVTPGDRNVTKAAQDIAYGADPRQRLDIYAPRDTTNAPVVVFFYGGSWNSGKRQDYAFAARALAARGFVTVVPDYRLVPQVRYPAFVEDGAQAVAWTAANIAGYGGNPARIGVSGHSAGAYIALMLTLDRRWLAAAGAPDAVKAAVGLAGPYDFAPFEPGGAAQAAFGHVKDVRQTQPITWARPGAPPVLLLQGAGDTIVLPHNATALAAAIGTSAQARIYPGVGHIGIILAISKPFRSKAPALADTAAFFHKHLG